MNPNGKSWITLAKFWLCVLAALFAAPTAAVALAAPLAEAVKRVISAFNSRMRLVSLPISFVSVALANSRSNFFNSFDVLMSSF